MSSNNKYSHKNGSGKTGGSFYQSHLNPSNASAHHVPEGTATVQRQRPAAQHVASVAPTPKLSNPPSNSVATSGPTQAETLTTTKTPNFEGRTSSTASSSKEDQQDEEFLSKLAEVVECTNKLAGLSNQELLQQYSQRLRTLCEENSKLRAENKTMQNERCKSQKEKEAQAVAHIKEIEQKNSLIDVKNTEIQKYKEDLKKQEKIIKALKENAAKIQHDSEANYAKYRELLSESQRKIRDEIIRETEKAVLEKEIIKWKAKAVHLNDAIDKWETSHRNLKDSADAIKSVNERLERENNEATSNMRILRASDQEKNEQIKVLTEERDSLQTSKHSVEVNLNEEIMKNMDLQKENDVLSEELESIANKVEIARTCMNHRKGQRISSIFDRKRIRDEIEGYETYDYGGGPKKICPGDGDKEAVGVNKSIVNSTAALTGGSQAPKVQQSVSGTGHQMPRDPRTYPARKQQEHYDPNNKS